MAPGLFIPITIRKSLIGQLFIWAVGLAAVALLFIPGQALQPSNPVLSSLLAAGAFVAILVTLLMSYVYGLSRIIMTANGLEMFNFSSALSSDDATLEWNQVQDIVVRISGLGSIFGYGTLIVHAANDQRDLVFTMTPRPEHWHDYMVQLAEAAKTSVTES